MKRTPTPGAVPMVSQAQPVRPDLVGVQPLYYVVIESRRFGSLEAMCRRMGLPRERVGSYVQRAQLERSEYVVIPELRMGEPGREICGLLILRPGGGVILCGALMDEASENLDEVQALAEAFKAEPKLAGRLVSVGSFRPNPKTEAMQ